jgi:chromosome segregation ATPase
MNKKLFTLIAVFVLAVCGSLPAVAGTAEQNQIIQIQATMQMLQDNMARMQQSLDERMGVMKVLMTQQTENVNKMGVAVQNLQKSLGAQTTDNTTKVDQISGQMKAMHDAVDELKARMAKLDKQLNDMQNAQRNISSPPSNAPAGNAAPSPTRPVK